MSLQGYVRDLILGFANAGHTVQFFIDSASLHGRLIAAQSLDHPLVTITDLDYYARSARVPINERALNYFRTHLFGEKHLVQKSTISATKRLIRRLYPRNDPATPRFDFMIGIEKAGLLWAGMFSEIFEVPFAYWSLELAFEDYGTVLYDPWIREYELYYHRRAAATIIQDDQRADVLFTENKVSNGVPCYFPVSASGQVNRFKNNYFHDRFGIPREKKILIYFGLFGDDRECAAVAELAQELDQVALIFHGYGSQSFIDLYKNRPNVFFSLDLVDEEEIDFMISAADIGLCLYNNALRNNRLTAFSSQKVALFMKNGVPILAYDNESYRRLFMRYSCGKSIADISAVPDAIREILGDLQSYRGECFRAFDEAYAFSRNFPNLLKCIAQGSLPLVNRNR